jgi:hypothetical protein
LVIFYKYLYEEISMKNAFGVALGVMALIWAYLALTYLSGYVVVWAGFIAWGAYHTVKDKEPLVPTISATIFGSVMATVALVIAALLNGVIGNLAIEVAIAVGITVYILTAVKAFSNVPANVFGYAATVALVREEVLNSVSSGAVGDLLQVSLSHPLINASLSFIGGAIFANLTLKLAAKLG